MKKLWLFLLLVLSSVASFAQPLRDSVRFNTPYFDITYSEVLEQPLSAYYRVVCPESNVSRSGFDFYTEPKIHTSNNEDYVSNVWDKGHLAPVGSIRCHRNMVYATFTYVNCALQHQQLNRGVWRSLESREQQLATEYEEVYVTIRLVFNSHCIKLPTGATVPIGFYKTIKYGDRFGFREEKYYFPNISPESKDINFYKIN